MIYRHVRNKERYNLAEAQRLVRQAFEAAAELRRDCDILPVVDENGASDCPFAEELFFRKEKTAQFVRQDLKELEEYASSAVTHVKICQNKLAELAEERARLHHQAPQRWIEQGEQELRNQLERHQQMQRDLKEAITEVKATLRESEARKFPGREPRGPWGEHIQKEPPKARPLEDIWKESGREETERIKRTARRAQGAKE